MPTDFPAHERLSILDAFLASDESQVMNPLNPDPL